MTILSRIFFLLSLVFLLNNTNLTGQDEINLFAGTEITALSGDDFFGSAWISPTIGAHFLWQTHKRLHLVFNMRYASKGFNRDFNAVYFQTIKMDYGLAIKTKSTVNGLVLSYDSLVGTSNNKSINQGFNVMAISEYYISERYKFTLMYSHGLYDVLDDAPSKSILFGFSYLIN